MKRITKTRVYATKRLVMGEDCVFQVLDFLFNDAAAGIRGDVDRLRDVEAALLGVG